MLCQTEAACFPNPETLGGLVADRARARPELRPTLTAHAVIVSGIVSHPTLASKMSHYRSPPCILRASSFCVRDARAPKFKAQSYSRDTPRCPGRWQP